MTPATACAVCARPAPANRNTNEPWCCSVACEHSYIFFGASRLPSRHDGVTMTCPVCEQSFSRRGRQRFCSDACRAAAYRRRREQRQASLVVPRARPRRPITVYECDTCGARSLGEQRCAECTTFMRRVGIGGSCPCCDEPIAVAELVGEEVVATS